MRSIDPVITSKYSLSLSRHQVMGSGICAKYGWDKDKLCGPRVMSQKRAFNQDLDCNDASHRKDHASHKVPKVNGEVFDARKHSKKLEEEGLIVKPPELKDFVTSDPKDILEKQKEHVKKFVPPGGDPKIVKGKPIYKVFHNGGKGF